MENSLNVREYNLRQLWLQEFRAYAWEMTKAFYSEIIFNSHSHVEIVANFIAGFMQ